MFSMMPRAEGCPGSRLSPESEFWSRTENRVKSGIERSTTLQGNTAIANILKMEGTEYLFCFPDNALIEAAAVAGIKPIMSRTERTTVNMADGYTRVTNGHRTGVVIQQPVNL